jgi:hypothetical protein
MAVSRHFRWGLMSLLLLAASARSHAGPVLSAPLFANVGGSTGSGFGTITISDDELTAFVQIFFSGLTGDATFAGFSGAFALPLIGVPFDTSGSPSSTDTITPGDVVNLEAGGGTFIVGSTFAPGGEIAGELPEGDSSGPLPPITTPVLVTPEPSSLVLGLLGFCVAMFVRKSRAA